MTAPRPGYAIPLSDIVLAITGTVSCADGPDNPNGPSEALTVSRVIPNTGPTDSPADVRIDGSGFRNGATVTVGGSPVSTTVVDAYQIHATLPPHAAGRVDIVVTNPNGESKQLTDGYTYVALAVTSVLPASGFSKVTILAIQGAGFVPGTTVTIGGVAAPIAPIYGPPSATSIAVTAPTHEVGAADVVITNPGGSAVTVASAFRFIEVTLTAGPGSVTAGDPLTINWSDALSGEWIGLFKVGDSSESYGWVVGTGAGTRTAQAPLVPGLYEFRYMHRYNGSVCSGIFCDEATVARSNQVTVTPAGAAALAPAVSVARRRLKETQK